MPRKTFTAGEVLAAADVNNFLMDQAVQTYTDSTARESAVSTATAPAGLVTYLEDEDKFEYWDGAAYEPLIPAAPASDPGLVHIATITGTGVNSVSCNDVFSSAYKNYRVVMEATVASSAAVRVRMRVNGDDTDGAVDSTYGSAFVGRTPAGGGPTISEAVSSSAVLTRTTTGFFKFNFDILDPFLAKKTVWTGHTYVDQAQDQFSGGIVHATSSSFDGFSLRCSVNLTDVTIQVFGYED